MIIKNEYFKISVLNQIFVSLKMIDIQGAIDAFFDEATWYKKGDIIYVFQCFLDLLHEKVEQNSDTLFSVLSQEMKYFQENNDLEVQEFSGGDETKPVCHHCILDFFETIGYEDFTTEDVAHIFYKILETTAKHPHNNLIFYNHEMMMMHHH